MNEVSLTVRDKPVFSYARIQYNGLKVCKYLIKEYLIRIHRVKLLNYNVSGEADINVA